MKKRILLESDEILVQAINALTSCEPRFEYVVEHTGMPKLRLRPDGFQTLLQAIVSQQVSVAAANAIWSRLEIENFLEEFDKIDVDEITPRQSLDFLYKLKSKRQRQSNGKSKFEK